MVAFPARPILTLSTPPNGGTGHSPDPLSSLTGCNALLNDLLESSPAEISRIDVAVLNLLCAPTLPGSEGLNIPDCVAHLDRLAAHVKSVTERNLYRFPSDPEYGRCEPMWRMCMLVTVLKRDYGAKYNPKHVAAIAAGRSRADVSDSRDSFLNGLLDADPNRRFGTCASIPVLVAAVARRLGYPVGLVVAGRHVFNRWNGGGLHFNVEASNPAGMTVESDDYYRMMVPWPGATPAELNSPYHLRTLSAEEEFSLFLSLRVECLVQAGRFDETLLWSARALQFAPDDLNLVRITYVAADQAMKRRYQQTHPAVNLSDPFTFDAGGLLRIEERSLYLTIAAHHQEAAGRLLDARQSYEDACRQNFHGTNEQRDLQRFLVVHALPSRSGPLMPPANWGQPRRWRLNCQPHEEAGELGRLAEQCTRDGELLKARDALHDLYAFDPGDAKVYGLARAIERQPRFQSQLRLAVASRKKSVPSKGSVSA